MNTEKASVAAGLRKQAKELYAHSATIYKGVTQSDLWALCVNAHNTMKQAADLLEAQPATAKETPWPYVETPGEFAQRLARAMEEFPGNLLAAVRQAMIENPPVRVSTAPLDAGAAALLEKANSLIATLRGQTDYRTDECNAWFREYHDFRRSLVVEPAGAVTDEMVERACEAYYDATHYAGFYWPPRDPERYARPMRLALEAALRAMPASERDAWQPLPSPPAKSQEGE